MYKNKANVSRYEPLLDITYTESYNIKLFILWRIDTLTGNDSVNIFLRKLMRALLGNGSVTKPSQQ
jgi:hypothetical protein